MQIIATSQEEFWGPGGGVPLQLLELNNQLKGNSFSAIEQAREEGRRWAEILDALRDLNQPKKSNNESSILG